MNVTEEVKNAPGCRPTVTIEKLLPCEPLTRGSILLR